jgi:hypothetical protein
MASRTGGESPWLSALADKRFVHFCASLQDVGVPVLDLNFPQSGPWVIPAETAEGL